MRLNDIHSVAKSPVALGERVLQERAQGCALQSELDLAKKSWVSGSVRDDAISKPKTSLDAPYIMRSKGLPETVSFSVQPEVCILPHKNSSNKFVYLEQRYLRVLASDM